MKQYNFWNIICGWVAFVISAITYILTTEDTASFWDCGEFISTANKLLVGHPPGAPFFMIIGRLFAIMAPDVMLISKSINIMSALCSAFTIMFLFWTITHLARKIFIDEQADCSGETMPLWRIIAVMGAGMVGALAYTFSDTFWFSAVEGEVYAMSSLFTAVVFWAILKWENVADEPHANRWLILIAYLIGLSIGVHLLNLLAIPAIGMIYYFKKYPKVTRKGVIAALAFSCVILGAILYGIIPGLVKMATYFELFFVNELGFGYNSGAIFYALLLVGLLIYAIYWTYKNNHVISNTILTAVTVIIIGYSSFAMVVIRSVSNPTMDQNSPEDVFALTDYLNREQYGNRPLLYGQSFDSPIDRQAMSNAGKGNPVYTQKDGKYEIVDYKPEYKYQACMLFPRMYSPDERHIEEYKSWTGFKGRSVPVVDEYGQKNFVTVPTFWENIKFFVGYQCNFMYWRYFMWNFSGRQNDIQGQGELIHGNWITGIPVIDNMMLGDQDLMPDSLKQNKGHNRYFMLPFILGLVGLFFQYGRGKYGKQGFWVVMLLFFLTGLAIVLYLNQTPLQVRERDYAYAGSFYAFAIWIGLGVLSIVELFRRIKKIPALVSAAAATLLCLLCVPCVMAEQNWDDHDRSGSTIARDLAYNYLNTCEENAIIFTNGDNDTFPLWYAQEVEGFRTDVRVCNLSYLQTGWYCDQMKRKAYKSDPLPISFTHEQYTGDRDVIYIRNKKKEGISLKEALDFIRSEAPATKKIEGYNERVCWVPSNTYFLNVDSAKLLSKGISCNRSKMKISISKGLLIKNDMMVLDMLQTSDWERPMYYAVTVGGENYVGLNNYFRLEGLAYRIAPYVDLAPDSYKKQRNSSAGNPGTVNTERMYDNIMNKFRWGFFNREGIYIDENKSRMAGNIRNNLARLAEMFVEEGDIALNEGLQVDTNGLDVPISKDEAPAYAEQKYEKARTVMEKLAFEVPDSIIPHNYFSLGIASCYYRLGLNEKADDVLRKYAKDNLQEAEFYFALGDGRIQSAVSDLQRNLYIVNQILDMAVVNEREGFVKELEDSFYPLIDRYDNYFRPQY